MSLKKTDWFSGPLEPAGSMGLLNQLWALQLLKLLFKLYFRNGQPQNFVPQWCLGHAAANPAAVLYFSSKTKYGTGRKILEVHKSGVLNLFQGSWQCWGCTKPLKNGDVFQCGVTPATNMDLLQQWCKRSQLGISAVDIFSSFSSRSQPFG